MHSFLQTQIIYIHQSSTSFQITYLKNIDRVKQLKSSRYIAQGLPLKLLLIQYQDGFVSSSKIRKLMS